MEDWPYNDIDFRGYPDMPLPDGEDFDDGGKNSFYFFLMFFNCFWYMHAYNISLVYADVGLERPAGMSMIARRVPHPINIVAPYQEGSDNEEEITRSLEGLTHAILEYARIGDMPRRY